MAVTCFPRWGLTHWGGFASARRRASILNVNDHSSLRRHCRHIERSLVGSGRLCGWWRRLRRCTGLMPPLSASPHPSAQQPLGMQPSKMNVHWAALFQAPIGMLATSTWARQAYTNHCCTSRLERPQLSLAPIACLRLRHYPQRPHCQWCLQCLTPQRLSSRGRQTTMGGRAPLQMAAGLLRCHQRPLRWASRAQRCRLPRAGKPFGTSSRRVFSIVRRLRTRRSQHSTRMPLLMPTTHAVIDPACTLHCNSNGNLRTRSKHMQGDRPRTSPQHLPMLGPCCEPCRRGQTSWQLAYTLRKTRS